MLATEIRAKISGVDRRRLPRFVARRMKRCFLPLTCVALLAWSANWSAASDVTPLLREAASEARVAGAPGISIVVVVDGQTSYWQAGTSGSADLPLTKRTLFETASLTKVFTTTLLGMDVARGAVTLDEPISKFLRGVRLRPRMRRATLGMLATFTAGLPLQPPDFQQLPLSEQGIDNYTISDFLRFVSGWQPSRALPAPPVYSDASTGLLGLCLAHLRLGILENRLQREIFGPLGMSDTTFEPDGNQANRLALGFLQDGNLAPQWPLDAMAAADGAKSSARDLGIFLRALLAQQPMPPLLAEGIAIASQAGIAEPGDPDFRPLAWTWTSVTAHGAQAWVITKNGDIPGFSSQIAFSRDLGIGAAILANRDSLPLRDITLQLIQRIANSP